MNTAKKSSHSGGQKSRSGETSKKLKQANSQEPILSQGDFLAQTFQSQITIQKESQVRGRVYGQSSLESYGIYDQDTQSWRTYQLSLFGGWEKLSETWPPSGMTRNGKLYHHRGVEPSTDVKGFGYWPTPRASDGKRLRFKASSILKVFKRNRESGNGFSPTLPELITVLSDGKRLRTSFVELMMGIPTSWTDCKCLVTASKFRSSSGLGKG